MTPMQGLIGLAVAGGFVWWYGRRNQMPKLPTVSEDSLGVQGVQSAAPETLKGLVMQGLVPPDAVDVYLVPGLGYNLAQVAGRPGVYAVPASLVSGGGGGLPAVLSGYQGFGRPMTVQRTTPSFQRPRPGALTMMTTPRLPSPRTLSGGMGFGQPVGWRAGQLYQPGTHDVSSGVAGLWY